MNRVVCRKEKSLKMLGSSRDEELGAGITLGLPQPGMWQALAVLLLSLLQGWLVQGDTRLRPHPDSGSVVR